jgi:hypothetical protein
MEHICDLAEFKSAKFSPVLPEDSQVNPGRYGAELAFWLCIELCNRGVVTSYPDYEDWGWLLSYSNEDGDEFAVLCGNIEGSNEEWLIAIKAYARKLFGRQKPPFERAAVLIEALRAVLESEQSIAAMDWRFQRDS